MKRLLLYLRFILLSSSVLTDKRDIEHIIQADATIHNLKYCGSCIITWLPEHSPCSGESTVIGQSGCGTMDCLCSLAYRDTREKWIREHVEDYCGRSDTTTPQLTVDWFETFCNAQIAQLGTSSAAGPTRTSAPVFPPSQSASVPNQSSETAVSPPGTTPGGTSPGGTTPGVTSPGDTTAATSPTTSGTGTGGTPRPSPGEIAGIVVGVVAAIAGVVGAYYAYKTFKHKKEKLRVAQSNNNGDGYAMQNWR